MTTIHTIKSDRVLDLSRKVQVYKVMGSQQTPIMINDEGSEFFAKHRVSIPSKLKTESAILGSSVYAILQDDVIIGYATELILDDVSVIREFITEPSHFSGYLSGRVINGTGRRKMNDFLHFSGAHTYQFNETYLPFWFARTVEFTAATEGHPSEIFLYSPVVGNRKETVG